MDHASGFVSPRSFLTTITIQGPRRPSTSQSWETCANKGGKENERHKNLLARVRSVGVVSRVVPAQWIESIKCAGARQERGCRQHAIQSRASCDARHHQSGRNGFPDQLSRKRCGFKFSQLAARRSHEFSESATSLGGGLIAHQK